MVDDEVGRVALHSVGRTHFNDALAVSADDRKNVVKDAVFAILREGAEFDVVEGQRRPARVDPIFVLETQENLKLLVE